MSPPVITDPAIQWLIEVDKDVPDIDWRARLLGGAAVGWTRSGRYDLGDLPEAGPVGGTLHLYSRANVNPDVVGDWSVGLVYTDYDDNSYRVLRCNGPHPNPHVNRIERDVIVRQAHVHRLTERYQRLRRGRPDGFAAVTSDFTTMAEAVEHLASAVNLIPAGRLLL